MASASSDNIYYPICVRGDNSGNFLGNALIIVLNSIKERASVIRDVATIRTTLAQLRFDLEDTCYLDSNQQIEERFAQFSDKDHAACSCVLFIILAEVRDDKLVDVLSNKIDIPRVIDTIDIASLNDKPKLFFIQGYSKRVLLKDSDTPFHSMNLPFDVSIQPDLLISCSVILNSEPKKQLENGGTYYFQEMCSLLKTSATILDVFHLMTLANRNIMASQKFGLKEKTILLSSLRFKFKFA
jgi:hypothetical protein